MRYIPQDLQDGKRKFDRGYAGRQLITSSKADGTADSPGVDSDRMKGYDLGTGLAT